MPETELSNLTTTGTNTSITDYKPSAKILDVASADKETYWYNSNWHTYLGYLKTIPQYWQAVRSLGIWAFGKGYICPLTEHQITLERIRGWGNESFDEILITMLMEKKTNGDAYAEIIRNDRGTLINIKKLDPETVRHVVNQKGLLIAYDVRDVKGVWQRLQTNEMFHVSNDRIGSEIHGTSVLEPCSWYLSWKQELMNDLRRLMHRSSLTIIYVDMDNTTKLSTVKTQWETALKNGTAVLLPGKKGIDFEVEKVEIPDTTGWLNVINNLDDKTYEVLGVSKIITGGVSGTTEANAKMGYMSFEQPYMTEQRLMEQDVWSQLAIRITFNRPASISSTMQTSEAANTGQTNIQPSDMMNKENE